MENKQKLTPEQDLIFREHADRLEASSATRLPDGRKGYSVDEVLASMKRAIEAGQRHGA